ncbi:MAG: hypothetical protein NXH95_17875 [Pseudomonadaceae bacterium]|nr:hypothetical protein [Pseudomonadaceae bacterium]
MFRRTISFTTLCVTLLLVAIPVEASDKTSEDSSWTVGVDIGTRWDSNINLASDEFDSQYAGSSAEFDDFTSNINLNISYALIETASQELVATLSGFHNSVSDNNKLSNTGATIALDYRGEFGSNFTDPWYTLGIEYTIAEWDDSRIRDGDWIDLEAAIGKRFTPKFGLSGGLRYLKRNQKNSTRLCPNRSAVNCPGNWREDEVFDQERAGAFIHADWFISQSTSVYFEYSYWDGDEDGTLPLRNQNSAQVEEGSEGWLNGQDVFADDPAFGRGAARYTNINRGLDFIVWRVEAVQNVFELGINQVLTDSISLAFVAAYMDASDVESPDRRGETELGGYENTAVMATLSFAF